MFVVEDQAWIRTSCMYTIGVWYLFPRDVLRIETQMRKGRKPEVIYLFSSLFMYFCSHKYHTPAHRSSLRLLKSRQTLGSIADSLVEWDEPHPQILPCVLVVDLERLDLFCQRGIWHL